MTIKHVVPDIQEAGCRFDKISDDLASKGWNVSDGFVPTMVSSELAGEIYRLWTNGSFRRVGIGWANKGRFSSHARSDQIMWPHPSHCIGAQRVYLDAMEELRLSLNRKLCLGLTEFESHMEVYLPGTSCRKQLDRLKNNGRNLVTSILYLNPNWSEIEGGQLRIYTNTDNKPNFQDILPIEGRLVSFLSAKYPHEVISSMRNRAFITGLFKIDDPMVSKIKPDTYRFRGIRNKSVPDNTRKPNTGSVSDINSWRESTA